MKPTMTDCADRIKRVPRLMSRTSTWAFLGPTDVTDIFQSGGFRSSTLLSSHTAHTTRTLLLHRQCTHTRHEPMNHKVDRSPPPLPAHRACRAADARRHLPPTLTMCVDSPTSSAPSRQPCMSCAYISERAPPARQRGSVALALPPHCAVAAAASSSTTVASAFCFLICAKPRRLPPTSNLT